MLSRLRDALRIAGGGADQRSLDEPIWVTTNGHRIDARLRDATGREHHVVARDTGRTVAIELVLSEPDPVPAHPPLVVVVNGPSGAGKSTLIQAIAESDTAPWVTFDEPTLGTSDQSLLVWRDRAPHLHRGFLEGIAALAAAGNAVAVAAGGVPQHQFRQALSSARDVYVGLDCPIPILVRREARRPDRWGGLALQSADAHEDWTYDLRIDTSEVPPHAAARSVLGLLV